MRQMRFRRLGEKARDFNALPDDASATDMAIAQVLGLAMSAGFRFDVIDGELVAISPTADWRVWPTLRSCLSEIGVEAILAYYEKTSQERRTTLSAAAL